MTNAVDTQCILKIRNKRGLHARASAKFVQLAEEYDVTVMVSKDGHAVGGTSIMGLMMLAAANGSEIHVSVSGSDAQKAMHALKQLVENRFGELE